MKYFISLLALTMALKAEVLHFFDTKKAYHEDTLYLQTGYFIANDPVSLKEFFDKWKNDYHPRNGINLALQDFRSDIGTVVAKKYYLGLYHRYNVFIKTNRDFTDFYRTAKNKLPFDDLRTYDLHLKIEGIKESGILLFRQKTLHEDEESLLKVGAAVHMGVGHDMQGGTIDGSARVLNAKSYEIDARSDYYYTHNYLYHLDVDRSYALGAGVDLSLYFRSMYYRYEVRLEVSDLLSRMYWFDLPYSYVNIQTKNKYYDENGYVKYNPSINGVEKYVNHTQTISPRYELTFRKSLMSDVSVSGIFAYGYDTFFPTLEVEKVFTQAQKLLVSYDVRFQSWGVGYGNEFFSIKLIADGFSHPSAVGVGARLAYRF